MSLLSRLFGKRPDDLAEVPALQGWRRGVFGEKALALKNGSLSLRIQRGRVVVG